MLLVTPDRGLCGALVSNVLKEASNFIDSIDANYEIRVIEKKERVFISKTVDKYMNRLKFQICQLLKKFLQ